ncbi:MAG: RimK/LysX family protein [Cyanobacteria bacterium P01_C01_bin.72]
MSKKRDRRDPEDTKLAKPIIGWREFANLPQLNIDRIKAKIDTGARSSAIHAFNIQELSRQGKQIIRLP